MAEIPTDSEDEMLSDSEEEYFPEENNSASSDSTDSEEDNDQFEIEQQTISKKNKIIHKWTKVDENDDPPELPPFINSGDEMGPEIGRPIHYFQLFFSNELLDLIVEQSNLFAIQNDPNWKFFLAQLFTCQ